MVGIPHESVDYVTADGQFHIHDVVEEWDWEPPVPEFILDEAQKAAIEQEILLTTPSEFVEFSVQIRDSEQEALLPFSFGGREYLREPYDTAAPRVLFKCGRQVEKTEVCENTVLLANGSTVKIDDIEVGDRVVTLADDGAHLTVGEVTWKSRRYKKPCVHIRSRQGHATRVATTHPMRTWDSWTEAGDLRVGDRLGVVRRAGVFGSRNVPWTRVIATAMLIGDGGLTSGRPNFTKADKVLRDEFRRCVEAVGVEHRESSRMDTLACCVHIVGPSSIEDWLVKDGLMGLKSPERFIPSWVWDLSREDTALFINRLWATDGHVKQAAPAKYDLVYGSASRRLVYELQRLLHKFGVPSRIRKEHPSYHKDRGNEDYFWELRVETVPGVRTFLSEIGALGKSEGVALPDEEGENNNRDTYPLEIAEDLKDIHRTREGYARRGRWVPQPSLRSAGLREKPKYPLTRGKLQEYVAFFRSDTEFDQGLVDALEEHLNTDIFWDVVTEYEGIGEQWCRDITVGPVPGYAAGGGAFIADGFITHNSTTLGNKLLSFCCMHVAFNALYVSPSQPQTKTFSNDRLKEPIVTSPNLGVWTNKALTDNVFLKKFINRSQITLRYAFLNADRVRGIPADLIALDEIQDIIVDNIPVIEECASHSPYKIFLYSGTPKSMDNTLEHYWQNFSTQNEWVIPCERHGTPKDPASWHWNVLDESNIGPMGLICDKCHSPIQADHPLGQWAAMVSNPKTETPYEGFRIPQLMVPWIEWDEIIEKQTKYSRGKFYNEVLGLSYDSGTRPLTQNDVVKCCHSEVDMSEAGLELVRAHVGNTSRVFAGIDWGTGEGSFTVLTLGTYVGHRFTIFYAHRFEGRETEPDIQIGIIKHIIKEWRISRVGVDYGGGFHPNDKLLRTFGVERIIRYQYSAPKIKIQWDDGLQRFMVHRTEVMSDIFNAIKRGGIIRFPKWEQWQEPFAADMLNIFSEYNEQRRMDQYSKTPGTTDDTFHSIVTCFLASMIDYPRPDVITPMRERDEQ